MVSYDGRWSGLGADKKASTVETEKRMAVFLDSYLKNNTSSFEADSKYLLDKTQYSPLSETMVSRSELAIEKIGDKKQ